MFFYLLIFKVNVFVPLPGTYVVQSIFTTITISTVAMYIFKDKEEDCYVFAVEIDDIKELYAGVSSGVIEMYVQVIAEHPLPPSF